MGVDKITTVKEERQKAQERLIRALLVLAGVALLYVFVHAYTSLSHPPFPELPDGQLEMLQALQKEGLVTGINADRAELVVSDALWKALDRSRQIEIAYGAASYFAATLRQPLPTGRILSNTDQSVLAVVDNTNFTLR